MAEESNELLTVAISYDIIKDIAPKELPFFGKFKESFLKNPDVFLEKDPKKKEKILGFGIPDGVVQLCTSFVLPIVLAAIKNYKTKKKENKLDNEELKKIRAQAYDNAIAGGMSKEKAGLMADALLGKMMNLK